MAKVFQEGAAAYGQAVRRRPETSGRKEHSYFEKEERCKRVFEISLHHYGEFWHLCTPGEEQDLIFRTKDDYVFAMTLVGMCAHDCPDVQIITFELMSNHVHFILCGREAQILVFFNLFKKRLRKYFTRQGTPRNLSHFDCERPILVETLESLRNQIGYTNRNNFVVDPGQTPFSYPYGANSYFFLPIAKERRHGYFGDLSILDKRKFVHSKHIDYPSSFILVDGYFSPVNYCRFDIGEGVFRDARHYFNKLSKNIEAYREISTVLGDRLFYTDQELADAVFRLCRERYDNRRPNSLNKNERLELAHTLHFDYNADNAQIARLLSLPGSVLAAMFPLRSK